MNTNMNYNIICKKLKVIPKYIINIQIRCTSQAAMEAKREAETIWLISEIIFLISKNHVIVKEIILQDHTQFSSL